MQRYLGGVSTTERDATVWRDAFLEDLTSEAATDEERALAAFAKAYIRRFADEQLTSMTRQELRAHVVGAFTFLQDQHASEIAVRVFHPTHATHGYETGGSVVEMVVDDSPFLVASVMAELGARELAVETILHPVVGIERDSGGRLLAVTNARGAAVRKSVQHFELDRRLTDQEVGELSDRLHRIVTDVQKAVRDFEPMTKAVGRMIELAREGSARYSKEEIAEATALLEWLLDDNCVFLGYREYRIEDTPQGRAIQAVPGSGLGILSETEQSTFAEPTLLSSLAPELAARYEEGFLLVVSKTNRLSTVHRRVKMDYFGVRHIGPDGSVIGEARLLGLFSSRAYMTPSSTIPVLRRKLARIIDAEDLIEDSHDHKLVVQLFESFPKEELFTTPSEELRRSIVGLIAEEERQQVRLFVRPDILQRSVVAVVTVPRDRFDAELRRQVHDLLLTRFGGSSVDYRLSLGPTGPARMHFTIWVTDGYMPEVSIEQLEQEIVALTRNWEDRLFDLLVASHGRERAQHLSDKWASRFPDYYRSGTSLEHAISDIERLEALDASGRRLGVGLHNETDATEPLTRLVVYRLGGKLELSEILPTLEALGLRVVEEIPTRLHDDDHPTFLHDFGVLGPGGAPLPLESCGDEVAATVEAVLEGETESDSIHRLVVTSKLNHSQLEILRAYRTYWRLVNPAYTDAYVNDALAAHPHIAEKLVALFESRFDPAGRALSQEDLRTEALADLDAVESLDQDRILRAYLDLIRTTVRTNAFKPDRSCLSLKLRSADVPDMPKPYPLYEVFVFAPDVEAIHLRGGMVARGGIRWSNRREDYRTEILGLMKAQMTKNAVIVPTGAKGGFVLRGRPVHSVAAGDEVRQAYITFMRGVLDVTDNLVDGDVIHPDGVVVYDGDDPYLVVAADKGTATFSDTANALAAQYGFWLGDAFASGGSAGYDHKALGITARGAWESVTRLCLEQGIDVSRETFTVVGIGDMSGDVFGNGMLLSDKIKLVAAFDHRHIFVDPDPAPGSGLEERRRLFELGRSSWDDYDKDLISPGGGVYRRSSKRVDLSERARRVLGVSQESLTPNELIRSILRAPVDLLWNGGIGTYVKASWESNEAVGDRSNDSVRISADELRCRVVVEGGNLGFTQPGRIEYATAGGSITTDFIDNSGGVDCSDREVNLKILLGLAVQEGDLDRSERDAFVAELAPDITEKVIYDNFLQAQILSQEVAASSTQLEAYEDLVVHLEQEGILDRGIEHLPPPDEMVERRRAGAGLTRPELAVLLAYAKRSLTDALLHSTLPEWPDFESDLRDYFPAPVVKRFDYLIDRHPLRRELVATVMANEVINSQGMTFVTRLTAETGTTPAEVVRAYRIARAVTEAGHRWRTIEKLDVSLEPALMSELLAGVDWLVEATARWYLAHPTDEWMADIIASTTKPFHELSESITSVGPPEWRVERDARAEELIIRGVPDEFARRHVFQEELVHAPDIIAVAHETGRSVVDVGRVFFLVGREFHLDKLEQIADRLPRLSRWERWGTQILEDDLLLLRRQLSEKVLEVGGDVAPEQALETFSLAHRTERARLRQLMDLLGREGPDHLSSLIVAARQIRALIVVTDRASHLEAHGFQKQEGPEGSP
jgi:glutamate dehydrogenase